MTSAHIGLNMEVLGVDVQQVKSRCSQCALDKICLPVGLNHSEMGRLEEIIKTTKPYQVDDKVYEAGSRLNNIYAVKSGMFKSYIINAEGNEHIVAFHLPGELFGLDAIHAKRYITTAKAIGTSTVCAIEYDSLTALSSKLPMLQKQLFNLMSKEFSSAQALLAEQSADRKLAGFLLSLSTRFKQRGYSETTFNLVMQRSDIANNLNMAPETVSRMFKRLKNEDIIELNVNEVTIVNMQQLQMLSGCLSSC
jgi:CRP/FNR family transcriptional regulator